MSSVGPVDSVTASLEGGRGRSASEEGPMAVECNLDSFDAGGPEGPVETPAVDDSCVVIS